MHLSLALLFFFSFERCQSCLSTFLPTLDPNYFWSGYRFSFKGRASSWNGTFSSFNIAPCCSREGEESDITSSLIRNWKLILFDFPVIFVSTLGIGYLAKAVLPALAPLSACSAIGRSWPNGRWPIQLLDASVFQSGLCWYLQGEGLLNDALVCCFSGGRPLTTVLSPPWCELEFAISVFGGFWLAWLQAYLIVSLTILDNMDAADVTGALSTRKLVLPISSYL